MLSKFVKKSALQTASKIPFSALTTLRRPRTFPLFSALKEKSYCFPYLFNSKEFSTRKVEHPNETKHSPQAEEKNVLVPLTPFGIQDFDKLRRYGYTYVDKTDMIRQIVLTIPCAIFTRPRRFGKSLILSTIKAIFEGEKEIFGDDLAIKKTDKEFWSQFESKYTVIKLDFSRLKSATSLEEFKESFCDLLWFHGWEHGLHLSYARPEKMLLQLIGSLTLETGKSKNQKLVLLIDEYDSPLNNAFGKEHLKDIHEELRTFFQTVKSFDHYLRFVFITGVAKYAHTSIFSGMNNLLDISHMPEYHALCGFTEKEVRTSFGEHIRFIASKSNRTEDEVMKEIIENYNGYRFVPNIEKSQQLVCPQLLYSYLIHGEVGQAKWFNTGSPSLLLEILKSSDLNLVQNMILEKTVMSMDELQSSVDPTVFKTRVALLLFQTGYLTFAPTFQKNKEKLQLVFPNLDVKRSFSLLVGEVLFQGVDVNNIRLLINNLKEENFQTYFDFIFLSFAQVPFKFSGINQREHEFIYHSRFSLINLVLANCTRGVTVEDFTFQATGEADTIINFHDKKLFIFEHKVDKSVETGIKQIKEKYLSRYLVDSKFGDIYIVSLNFSSKTINLKSALVQKVEKPSDPNDVQQGRFETKILFKWNALQTQ